MKLVYTLLDQQYMLDIGDDIKINLRNERAAKNLMKNIATSIYSNEIKESNSSLQFLVLFAVLNKK